MPSVWGDEESMKWMEFIRLQTADISEAALKHVVALPQKIIATPGLAAAEVYEHASVAGDIALLLIWETERPQYHGSLVGLQLAGELKNFGLIAHAVWISVQNEGV